MPVHRVPRFDIESEIAKIEAAEKIVAVTGDGDGALLVITEPKQKRKAPGEREVRS